jgi:RNA-binding protein 5/10
MPFPPGVGERSIGEIDNAENYEVITADRAIDENNVGNRILRNMGWQEGLV